MQFKEDELKQFSQMVWQSILGLDVKPSDRPFDPGENHAEGCVQITGAWRGVVTLSCPGELARRVTEIMFHLEPGKAESEEIQDAVGELANMVGGNLKALMPPPCELSLPIVALNGHKLHFPMTEIVCRVTLECLNHQFQLTILKQKESTRRISFFPSPV